LIEIWEMGAKVRFSHIDFAECASSLVVRIQEGRVTFADPSL